ncbi:MAG: pyridoxamine 5'-phosphate oxidase family protein [Propioniciclava sp.]|uniref:pyridoxamine 5'-phosphate oxidase family protein n=1 Tax=Propioniciclava sp. TaxID=2038686 RepID=UPI0039E61063
MTIEPDECRRLLAEAVVGRVSWVSPTRGIQVLPVNYLLEEELIVFRVHPASVLAELASPTEVAFEVDDLDAQTATGWSVLAQGRTATLAGELPETSPWAPGDREVAIAIEVSQLSGRSVSREF